jgi:hypothetical protein
LRRAKASKAQADLVAVLEAVDDRLGRPVHRLCVCKRTVKAAASGDDGV